MKYILLFIALVMIGIRFHWYVREKKIQGNLLRYSGFSMISSGILSFLHMNTYDFLKEGVSKDEWISLSAIFTAYMIIAIFYPILRNTIDKYSEQ